jgi:guanylate kinase
MIYVLCGPGGAGKDTVLDKVVAKGLATRVVSYTTRPRRHGEVKGKAYHFVSREEFEAKLATGDFIEHVTFNENYYGLPEQPFKESLTEGTDCIVVVESEGLKQLRALYGNLVEAIYLFASESRLRARMIERGDLETTVEKRMARLGLERQLLEGLYEYKLLNKDGELSVTVDMVASIIKANLARVREHTSNGSHSIQVPPAKSSGVGTHATAPTRVPDDGC